MRKKKKSERRRSLNPLFEGRSEGESEIDVWEWEINLLCRLGEGKEEVSACMLMWVRDFR